MRIVRYRIGSGPPAWGVHEGAWIADISNPFEPGEGRGQKTGTRAESARATLLAPVLPSKIVGVAANYPKHAAEMGNPTAEEPRLFLKAPSALVGPNAPIVIPPRTVRVDPEGELGVVIGRRMSRVSPENVAQYVFGYTIVNDVTARDFQQTDKIFGRAKSFDSFCPVGPWIETEIDPTDLAIVLAVDGEARASGRTSDMTHKLGALLSFISQVMTLEPGDLIATGTPPGVAPISAGNLVSISIDGIGVLENPVTDRDDRR